MFRIFQSIFSTSLLLQKFVAIYSSLWSRTSRQGCIPRMLVSYNDTQVISGIKRQCSGKEMRICQWEIAPHLVIKISGLFYGSHKLYYRRRQGLPQVNCCHVAAALSTEKCSMFHAAENQKVKLMQAWFYAVLCHGETSNNDLVRLLQAFTVHINCW